MGAVFVTSTGTGIGKTFVTAALVRHFRAQGRAVDAFKPVLSGFDPGHAEDSDTGQLLKALGRALTQEEFDRISPWRFAAPLSPDMAAAREHRNIDFRALVDFSRAAAQAAEIVLIEGAGGIMAPLDDKHTMLDWMRGLASPVLLVAGSYLGTISHTLSAADVLAHHHSDVRAIVVSESEDSPAPLGETLASIARFTKPIEVIALPRRKGPQHDHAAIGQIAAAIGS